MAGVASGVFPKGMQGFFSKVKHCASSDALPRRQGLFPLPVKFSFKGCEAPEGPSKASQVSAWTSLTCLALNMLAGWDGPVPEQRKSGQCGRAVAEVRG